MSQYLIFQLHGPMASWGVDAPGEVRHTHELPSRSALLGLLAAGVGIRRDDTERLNAFNRHYSLVVCASRNPRWARDYHTVQMPKEVRKARYFSRREELSDPDLLSAIISRRDYYTDAWWMRGQAEGSDVWLHQQQAALDWLAAQGERSGFTLLDTSVDAYRQQQLRWENSWQLIQFSSVDYTGMLTVTDPGLFLQRLSQGYGKSRAFGCGLMLIKPGAEA
ncbi:type I-E CRISPR-associated protein Cas6/Cse3/CasE [Escherichia coli]